jgi:acyl-CoA hydrolase
MHFVVEVRAREPHAESDQARLCTQCVIVFVALEGVEGKPVPVPAWVPRDADEQTLATRALRVMGLSKDIEQAIAELGRSSATPTS